MPTENDARVLATRKPRLRIFADDALNAETAPEDLDAPLTPAEAFFVRNNGTLPRIDADAIAAWRLTIDGEVETSRSFGLDELRAAFPVASVTAVLECAGNGRAGFSPATDGIQWTRGAVGCARWTGVRLADVLAACGVKAGAVYTGHESIDVAIDGSGRPAISRGLPIGKALSPETLLAFAMNDEPLPLLQGGPLRIVAPGFPGSAWQKWLTRVWVRDREHDGVKMTGLDYRLPTRPVVPGESPDPAEFAVIVEMPVKSLITHPAAGFSAQVGETIEVRGFAWSGGPPVVGVSISCDGGGTWAAARLEEAADQWVWRRFRRLVDLDRPGPVAILARAVDATGRSQPLDVAPWNPRGYCNNAVHLVEGRVEGR